LKEGFTNILGTNASDGLKFTVNVGLDLVPVVVGAGSLVFSSIDGVNKIPEGNNVVLESAAVMYPYQFTWAQDTASNIKLQRINDADTTQIAIPQIAPAGKLQIPWVNSFFILESYLPDAGFVGSDSRFELDTFSLQVSMQNVPAILDGKTLPVVAYIKIHTTEMLVL